MINVVDRRLLPHVDWPLIAAICSLTLIGLSTIYSVTWDFRNDQPGSAFWGQIYALPVALTAMLVCMLIDYRTLAQSGRKVEVHLLVAVARCREEPAEVLQRGRDETDLLLALACGRRTRIFSRLEAPGWKFPYRAADGGAVLAHEDDRPVRRDRNEHS
jgi:hypothetical protein